jgi:hypothetical protein
VTDELFDEVELDTEETFQPHRTDDPDVWGLQDVARGRTPLVPTTIYNVAGDSASGVAGLLKPDNTFLPKYSSKVGQILRIQIGGADDGQHIPNSRTLPQEHQVVNAPLPTESWLETVWDGAVKQPEFKVCDPDTGVCEMRQEHSHGLLLGSYSTKMGSAPAEGRRRSQVFNQTGFAWMPTRDKVQKAA